jgi:hypothetical protein
MAVETAGTLNAVILRHFSSLHLEEHITMTNFTFDSRETYLAYRQDWKARYKAASDDIRATKKNLQHYYKEGNYDEASYMQSKLHFQRVFANKLMVQLTEAKAFKNEQLAARKPVEA